MIAAREYLKTLIVIPVIILFNISNIFSSEMDGMSPATLLCYKIFSSTTRAGVTTFVLTITNLYFLFLFNLMYGTYIFSDANNCGTYIFPRLKDRRDWFYKKVRTMILFSFCYIALAVICLTAISVWESKEWPDGKTFAVASLMLFFFTLLSALTSTAISLLSFRVGSVTAFITVYFIEAMMVLSVLIPSNTMVAKVWSYLNPFGGIFSLDDLGGKIYGLIGRNGSGKTMLLRMLAGLIQPTDGQIRYKGTDGQNEHTEGNGFCVGITIENAQFYPEFTGFKNLQFLAQINNLIGTDDIKKALLDVGLEPDDNRIVRKYSMGMKQRLAIAQAIMENPDILLLDEPTNALDESGVILIQQLIKRQAQEDTIVVIASHSKEDVGILCDELFMMEQGRISPADSKFKKRASGIPSDNTGNVK